MKASCLHQVGQSSGDHKAAGGNHDDSEGARNVFGAWRRQLDRNGGQDQAGFVSSQDGTVDRLNGTVPNAEWFTG